MPATAANPAVQKPAAERVQPVMPSANGTPKPTPTAPTQKTVAQTPVVKAVTAA